MMKSCIFLALLGLAIAKVDYTGYKVFRAHPTLQQYETIKTLEKKYELDIWSEMRHEGDFIDFMVSPTLQPVIEQTLRHFSIAYDTFIEDVEAAAAKALLPSNNAAHSITDTYYTLTEINDWMKTFASDNSDLVSAVLGSGKSYEGNDINYLKISAPSTGIKKAFVMTCGIHAREWISPAVCMNVASMYVDAYREGDSDVSYILSEVDIYMVPVSNPDGYSYTWSTDRMWRKTRRVPGDEENCLKTCIGTDPNRNYDNHFCESGASESCCTQTYCGPYPFSELETAFQRDLVNSLDNVKGYIDIHAYSQLWMIPYGYKTSPPPNYDTLMTIAENSVAAIRSVHSKIYEPGSIANVIYEASGSSADYFYEDLKIKCSFAAELRDKGRYGFVLPESQILPTSEETFAGLNEIARSIASGMCD